MDPDLAAAVLASRRWYDDVFDLHRLPHDSDDSLWWADGEPPRWHSAVKTLLPTTDPTGLLTRAERHPRGSVADSFGLLDLVAHGYSLLFAATWVHHPGVPTSATPRAWTRVLDSTLMAEWNARHDTTGVLPDDVWRHPRFTVLARHDGDALTGGAVLHDAGPVVELSNTWSAGAGAPAPGDLLALAASSHPGRAVAGYADGAELETLLAAGFRPLGPQHVWVPRPDAW